MNADCRANAAIVGTPANAQRTRREGPGCDLVQWARDLTAPGRLGIRDYPADG